MAFELSDRQNRLRAYFQSRRRERMTPISDRPTLIIATYNRGPRIAATLDSIFRQTVPAAEVIVVDDCSSDGTGGWIESHYPTVRVVSTNKNSGTSSARNAGAWYAKQKWLMFLDHDDELLPNAIETLLDLKEAFPEAGALFADHTYHNYVTGVFHPNHHTAQPAFHRLRGVRPLRTTTHGRLFGWDLYLSLLQGNLLQQPWMVNRDTLCRLGGFADDIRYCEDWDLYLRLLRSVPIALSDAVISNHIIEGENLHLSPNQSAMHQQVISRRIRYERGRSIRAVWALRRKLAGYLKWEGDQESPSNLRRAWKKYFSSFRNWPLDYVVAARLMIWPMKMLFGSQDSNANNAEAHN